MRSGRALKVHPPRPAKDAGSYPDGISITQSYTGVLESMGTRTLIFCLSAVRFRYARMK